MRLPTSYSSRAPPNDLHPEWRWKWKVGLLRREQGRGTFVGDAVGTLTRGASRETVQVHEGPRETCGCNSPASEAHASPSRHLCARSSLTRPALACD